MLLHFRLAFAALVAIAGCYDPVSGTEVDRSGKNGDRAALGIIHMRSKVIDTRDTPRRRAPAALQKSGKIGTTRKQACIPLSQVPQPYFQFH